MHLSPHGQERPLQSCAAEPARRRQTHCHRLGPGEPAWLPRVAPRAYASLVHLGSEDPDVDVRTGKGAVRPPLPDGWVTTAWGAELHSLLRAAEALNSPTAVRVPA